MEKFCQSCAMPLTEELLGTEKDGSNSSDYCSYCYKDGKFTGEMTMGEMLEFSIKPMVEFNDGMTEEKARQIMSQALPTLKRWK